MHTSATSSNKPEPHSIAYLALTLTPQGGCSRAAIATKYVESKNGDERAKEKDAAATSCPQHNDNAAPVLERTQSARAAAHPLDRPSRRRRELPSP